MTFFLLLWQFKGNFINFLDEEDHREKQTTLSEKEMIDGLSRLGLLSEGEFVVDVDFKICFFSLTISLPLFLLSLSHPLHPSSSLSSPTISLSSCSHSLFLSSSFFSLSLFSSLYSLSSPPLFFYTFLTTLSPSTLTLFHSLLHHPLSLLTLLSPPITPLTLLFLPLQPPLPFLPPTLSSFPSLHLSLHFFFPLSLFLKLCDRFDVCLAMNGPLCCCRFASKFG